MITYLIIYICIIGQECKELSSKQYHTRSACESVRLGIDARNHSVRMFTYKAECIKLGEQRE